MGLIDATIVVVYVLATTLLGIWLGRGQANNRDFFLGGYRLPTWALLISIVATETSTVTFLSVPGLSYVEGGNFTFLQIAIGYIIGRLAIVVWLLPGYFRGETLTAYQRLEKRFGVSTRRLASFVFLVTRNLADGLRLFLTALALNIAVGLNMPTCILVVTIATALYSCMGGVRSVVWNDCIQFAVYMLGAAIAAFLLVSRLPGGWEQFTSFAESTGRLRLFDFDTSLTNPSMTFWSGCIGGAFLSLATHGVDQLIVQRYLCANSRVAASWALGLSGFVVLAQFALFLLIGAELACFNSVTQGIGSNASGDQAFMTFVVKHMGVGLKGLILAAVLAAAMSTLSSSLNASASSVVGDWLGPILPTVDERNSLRWSRLLTLVFAGVQCSVAIAAYKLATGGAVVDAVLKIAGFAIGLLLGLYALGGCSRRKAATAAAIAIAVTVYILVARPAESVILAANIGQVAFLLALYAIIGRPVSQRIALSAFAVGTTVTCWVAFATPINGYWYTLVGSGTIVIVGLWLTVIAAIVELVLRYFRRTRKI